MEMLRRRNLKKRSSSPSSPLLPLSFVLRSSSSSKKTTNQQEQQQQQQKENTPPLGVLHPNVHPIANSSPPKKAKENTPTPNPTTTSQQPEEEEEEVHRIPDDPSVKVVVRIKPVSGAKGEDLWFVRNISHDSVAVGDRTFAFHSVLGPGASQGDVFDLVGVPLVHNSLAGFNTCVVCYGQSGSGKSYTMWGPPSSMVDGRSTNTDQGIVPRVFHMLFSHIHRRQECSREKQTSYQCRCSFIEIYNEQINDLLDPTQRDLQIRDGDSSNGNGTHMENLTDEYVTTAEDVSQLVVKGLSNRKVGATSMNLLKSSRSHVIFTCIIEAWSKGFSSNCFSSSRTSRITFVDLAGPDMEELDCVSKHCIREEIHVKKSLSRLGKLVNILSDTADSRKDTKYPYKDSCLTHVLRDTLGGNSKVTFLCAISSEYRCKSGTLSTLRFGERAKLIQNKAVINEITEDDVNGLSDQIRQLKEELIRTKSGGAATSKAGCFSGQNARESLHLLRVSLNRSLILPHIDNDSEEEVDVDEDDVKELCSQINNLHSSSEDTFEDFLDAESSLCDIPSSKECSNISEEIDQSIIDGAAELPPEEGAIEEDPHELPKLKTTNSAALCAESSLACQDVLNNVKDDQDKDSVRKCSLSVVPCQQMPSIQDPTLCSSPKIHTKPRKSTISPGLSVGKLSIPEPPVTNSSIEASRKNGVRSSLQSVKLSPTESLAESLHQGLHIMEHHQQNPAPRRSFVGLSFDHFALNTRQSIAKIGSGLQTVPDEQGSAASVLCSSSKRVVDKNGHNPTEDNSGMQIVLAKDTQANELNSASLKDNNISMLASKREVELEALCKEQAAKIKQLTILVDQYRQRSEDDAQGSDDVTSRKELKERENTGQECDDTAPVNASEKEALTSEIQSLRDQLKHYTDGSANDCLLEQIRNGTTEMGGENELEKERQKWTESESRWISLTEELRVDLESNRRLAEKTEMELSMEKKCTAELDDALQRAIYGHARIVEHYAELQEMYNDLLERHRRVMEGVAEVKRAAAKAGRKGCGTAFAAALSAELSTLRIDREKERGYLKEQNRRLRIQLRDTAEAVHAAGELLVRLREAEEISSRAQERCAAVQQDNEKLKKQMEKMKKKHTMEMDTMKNYLAESRLPESALKPFYRHETVDVPEDSCAPPTCDEDQSWRAAFTDAYQ